MPFAMALQLILPILEELPNRSLVTQALVEVVFDEARLRVRPVEYPGWVRFPKHLRKPGARYRVEALKPLPGGAWVAVGRIRRVRGPSHSNL